MKAYTVKEIFGPTIQGEGFGTGQSVFFIRFTGCNKWTGRQEDKATSACPFCDTDFVGGDKLDARDILDRLEGLFKASRAVERNLVISGGEPTLQLDYFLTRLLSDHGWRMTLETNGSKDVQESILALIDHVSCSPKQSPENTKIKRIDSLKVLHPADHQDRNILRFNNCDFLTDKQVDHVYIQPVMDKDYLKNLEECIALCHTNGFRLSLQTHKQINVK